MFFLQKSQEESLDLLIDMQSAIIRVAIVHYKPGHPVEIPYICSAQVPHHLRESDSLIAEHTTKSLSHVIHEATSFLQSVSENHSQNLPKHIGSVHYMLSSPWISSNAKTASISFPENTKITSDRINDILKSGRPAVITNGTEKMIEEKVFDIKLNGYSVESWDDKSAKQLDVSYAISVIDKHTESILTDACRHIVSRRHIGFHSSLLLQYIGVRQIMPEESDYLIVHIHGELTDVVVVERKSCVFFGSYATGTATIVRDVAKKIGVKHESAESAISLYIGGYLDSHSSTQYIDAIDSVSRDWIGAINKLLRKGGFSGKIPDRVMLTARSHEEFFLRSYKNSNKKAVFLSLGESSLRGTVSFGKNAEHLRVIALATIAIHIIKSTDFGKV